MTDESQPENFFEGEPVCPSCGKRIGRGASVGGTVSRIVHLTCFVAERRREHEKHPPK